eukprot:62014-Rhodomonas_salina.1
MMTLAARSSAGYTCTVTTSTSTTPTTLYWEQEFNSDSVRVTARVPENRVTTRVESYAYQGTWAASMWICTVT